MPEQKLHLIEVVAAYWPVLACSFLVSFAATPLCRWVALRKRIVDRPDDWLKPHKKPIPYLGGMAIFVGWASGLLLALVLFRHAPKPLPEARPEALINVGMTVGVLAAGTAVMLMGLFDDLRLASPQVKLSVTTAVALFLTLFGIGDDTILVALRSTGFLPEGLERWLVLVYSLPLSWFIVVGACNATNLIDGVDGLCSGVLGIISAGFLVLAVHLHLWSQWHPWDVQRVVLALSMMGAALGFFPYNRSPATIFMGDAGSMLLGLNAAVLMLLFTKSNAVKWLIGSLMVFALPTADMALTIARRWRNQRPLMEGDRSHFYDQLLDRGWPVKRVVRSSYSLTAFFALMGCVAIALRTRHIILLHLLVAAIVVAVIVKMKMVRVDSPEPGDDTTPAGSN